MWSLMPDHIRDRVVDRLIEDNPRVFWMTVISLLDAEQHKQDQQRDEE